MDANLKALAHLWKGRSHRQKAEYEQAFEHIQAARELASTVADSKTIIAVIQVQLGWLIFQRGDVTGSLRVFNEAEQVLKHTDHWIALGNIDSSASRRVSAGTSKEPAGVRLRSTSNIKNSIEAPLS